MASLERQRKAIHQQMLGRRTGRNIQSDLNALTPSQRRQGGLRQLEPRGARPATSSPGTDRAQPSNTPTGGIASPLTEKTKEVGGREYYATGLPSTDGLLMLPAIKKITMTDANGSEVIFEYAEPGV